MSDKKVDVGTWRAMSHGTTSHGDSNTLVTLHLIGNAHLDPAWMWEWAEGMEAFIATCRSALDRMNETSNFVFTCSSAAHYSWVEEIEPELFEAIRRRVEEGRWEFTGGWWVQADCNIPSGEGFARQALLGQRYFLEKFGRMATTGYSPDAFGHNRGLPQLLARAGMSNYIFCRPDPTELSLPSPLFSWRSPDGSQVLAYRVPFHYNMYESSVPKKVADILGAWEGASTLASGGEPLSAFGDRWALFYGVGNHGGGPTREHIRQIIEIGNDPTMPDMRFSRLDEFFDTVREERSDRFPEWDDDLQLNAPGCYSAHSGIKKLNRMSEHFLMASEKYSSLASLLLGVDYPADDLGRAWRNVCFNHFHDILCGVAIREALDHAIEMYGESLAIARRGVGYAMQRIARHLDTTGPGQTLVVFNPHSWDVARHVTFELWHDIDKSLWSQPVNIRVTDDDGNDLPHQMGFTSGKIGRDRIAATFRADIPALGWRCYRIFYGEASSVPSVPYNQGTATLENDLVRVEFSPESGAISRFYHKCLDRELLSHEAALPVAIEDTTDTWGHGVTTFNKVIGTFNDADLRLVENGPTHATIRSRSRWRNSWVQQDFRLYREGDNIEVDVKLFWAEDHVMLKLAFGANVSDPESVCEAAYTSVSKPCDGVERPCGTWSAIVGNVNGTTSGLGIVSDAKGGYSADGNRLAVTVLRSPSYATHEPHPFHSDEDLDFLDQGVQHFRYVIVPITSDSFRSELFRESAVVNVPLHSHLESAHPPPGNRGLRRSYRGIEVSPANVVATVLKRSEDGSGWTVRLFETDGVDVEASVRVNPLDITWNVAMKGHEVRTFLVVNGGEVREVGVVEV